MSRSRTTTVMVLAVLVLVAGCSGGSGSGGADLGEDVAVSQEAATSTPMATSTAAADAEYEGEKAGGNAASQATSRKLIRTAEVTLEVNRFEASRGSLASAARSAGGYVSHTSMRTEEVGNKTFTRGTVVLRVPAGKFSGFLETVKAEGKVISVDAGKRDVTRQHADLKARLKNLKRERARLRELYQQANDTEAILKVEARLSEVQGRIERIQARLETLENKVAYATITVHLREPRPEPKPPERTEWYETGVIAAFMASVSGVGTVLRAIVVGTAYALPYLLAFGVPVLGVAVAYRTFYRQV